MPLYSEHIGLQADLICSFAITRAVRSPSLFSYPSSAPSERSWAPISSTKASGMSVASKPPGVPQISSQGDLSGLFHAGLGDGTVAASIHNNCNMNTALEDDGCSEFGVRVRLTLSKLSWDQYKEFFRPSSCYPAPAI